jgi:hypothetical protein
VEEKPGEEPKWLLLHLPPKLYLQLDGTTRQNKNQYLFGYLGGLIARGVFDEILVSFLPVGHTHEDIDALFSRFSKALTYCHARSRPELARVLKNGHRALTEVFHLDRFTNISDYFKDNNVLGNLSGTMG